MQEQAIFEVARKIDSTEAREAYLQQICAGDVVIAQRVRSLLAAHAANASFLESPAVARIDTTTAPTFTERLGSVIGPYKLKEQIGEGGMGLVFVAEQHEPVRRKVALKLIKPGMDSRQVIARFEAERQALALMNHANIAKVFDGGETPSGRPYFVMELVKGVPITEYCDQNRLTPRARLELFGQVCAAVQHAHQKGIIHRDIKPSNVIVSSHDGTPVVKVIDFGVAKAIGQQLTDKSVYTNFSQFIGTPLYMSPEQAGQSDLDIDTRTDVYALGVLLYELLTGTTPFDKERLSKASYDEIRRLIREEEPPKPSTRMSTLNQKAGSTVSAQFQSEPKQLCQMLRGELDWIVMKALEKDRSRRYESASALAADVRRYLNDDPVEACPPSRRYRLGKFLRKHRTGVLTAAAVLGMVLVLGAVAFWVALDRSARRAEFDAQQAATAKAVDEEILEAAHWQRLERWDKARETLERAKVRLQGHGPSPLQDRIERSFKDIALVDRLQEARLRGGAHTIAEEKREADQLFGELFAAHGLDVGAAAADAIAAQIRTSAIREQLVTALEDWASIKDGLKRDDGAALRAIIRLSDDDPWRNRVRDLWEANDIEALVRLAKTDDVLAQPPANLLLLCERLGRLIRPPADSMVAKDRWAERTRFLRRAQQRYQADFWINYKLSQDLTLSGFVQKKDPAEAIGFLRAAIALQPQYPEPYYDMGVALWHPKTLAEALLAFQEAVAKRPTYAEAQANLGNVLRDQLKMPEAEAAIRRAIDMRPTDARFHIYLGDVLRAQRKSDQAVPAYEKAISLRPRDADAYNRLGFAFGEQEKRPEAIAAFRKVIELENKHAKAYWSLGFLLEKEGEFAPGLAARQRAHELASQSPKWGGPPPANFLRLSAQYVRLDPQLPKYLSGELVPKDAIERLDLAALCWLPCRQFYAASERFYREAFAAAPKFENEPHYTAASSAALAGCGRGKDAGQLEPKEYKRLRNQALAWLYADLAAQQKLFEASPLDNSPAVRQEMCDWQADANFDGLRGDAALAMLPEIERPKWRQFWQDVSALEQRAIDSRSQ